MNHPDELSDIPPVSEGRLRILPLGGVGEFGKNCMMLEYGDDIIIVDCGQMFPDADQFGVDCIIPDFTYLHDNVDRFRGVVLTHGHEDHIGAVPYLVRQFADEYLPIFGSELTLALVGKKLEEMGVAGAADLHVVRGGDMFNLGAFQIAFIPVNHSCPMSMALEITLPIGRIIHTGDYRLDDASRGDRMSLENLLESGEFDPTLLLLADSTNIEREGRSVNEDVVREGLAGVISNAPRTVVVAAFSSSISRVQTVLDLAQEQGRKVSICGYSLERNFEIAFDLGIIHYPESLVVPLQDLRKMPPRERLIMITGTQGEPRSALSRLAMGDYRGYDIEPGDLVVLSSRMIPGNEKAIYRMINNFYRHGARVVTERDARVHGSGHAYRDEMRALHRGIRPKFFTPVHGELRQLIMSGQLAEEVGMPKENIFVIENGMMMELDAEQVHTTRWTDLASPVLVDGKMLDDVHEWVLRDRKHLSEDGMLTVIMVIDKKSHKIIAGPDIVSRGFVVVDDNEDLMEECKQITIDTFHDCNKAQQEDWEEVKSAVRKSLRKFLAKRTDRYPVILPVVVEM